MKGDEAGHARVPGPTAAPGRAPRRPMRLRAQGGDGEGGTGPRGPRPPSRTQGRRESSQGEAGGESRTAER